VGLETPRDGFFLFLPKILDWEALLETLEDALSKHHADGKQWLAVCR
jgi:hypothetical protein